MDVTDGIEAEPPRDAGLDQFDDAANGSLRVIGRHEGEVAILLGPVEFRHLPLVDAVGIDDDPALGSLAEHLGQAHDRDGARLNDVREHLAGPNRGKLIDVADDQQGGLVRHRLEQRVHEQDIHH